MEVLLNPGKYNRRVRPVARSEDAVNVTFGLVVREIEDLVRCIFHFILSMILSSSGFVQYH